MKSRFNFLGSRSTIIPSTPKFSFGTVTGFGRFEKNSTVLLFNLTLLNQLFKPILQTTLQAKMSLNMSPHEVEPSSTWALKAQTGQVPMMRATNAMFSWGPSKKKTVLLSLKFVILFYSCSIVSEVYVFVNVLLSFHVLMFVTCFFNFFYFSQS